MKPTAQLRTEAETSVKFTFGIGTLVLLGLIVPAAVQYGWLWVGAYGIGFVGSMLFVLTGQYAIVAVQRAEEAREAEGLAAMLDREMRKETMQ
jgi:hypothetical protein